MHAGSASCHSSGEIIFLCNQYELVKILKVWQQYHHLKTFRNKLSRRALSPTDNCLAKDGSAYETTDIAMAVFYSCRWLSFQPRNSWLTALVDVINKHTHTHNRFTALFPGPPGWASARRELLDFMVQGKINGGRHTDHPAGRHSIPTKQLPPPPSPHIFLQAGCPSCRPTNSVKALKAMADVINCQ